MYSSEIINDFINWVIYDIFVFEALSHNLQIVALCKAFEVNTFDRMDNG